MPKDLGDPLPQAWQIAWGGHALQHQPLDYWQSNMYWPLENSLAFSDALVGYAPFGMIGEGFEAAIARYDLLFLFAYALAFIGAYLLARELGVGRAAAAVAGVAFAYAPWRLEQDGHMHVISSGGIPLALFLLVRGYRRGSVGTVVAGWLVATWQLALGFTLGLMLAYLLAVLAVVLLLCSWRRERPPRGLLAASAAGAAVFAAMGVLLALPYQEVRDDHPESERTADTVAAFSGGPEMFLAAPDQSTIWGPITEPVRDELDFVPEQTLFPGLLVLVLAGFGLSRASPFPKRLRIGLGVGVLALAVLSLGFQTPAHGVPYPYRAALRARAGMGRDPHARAAEHAHLARAWRCSPPPAPTPPRSRGARVEVARSGRRAAAARAGRGHGVPESAPDRREAAARARGGDAARGSTCRCTSTSRAASSCGRRTASPTSSTGAAASSRPSSTSSSS